MIAISALTGDGLDILTAHLQLVAGFEDTPDTFSARARHLELLGGYQLLVGRDVDERRCHFGCAAH